MEFSELRGMTLCQVEGMVGSDQITFTEYSGRRFRLYHEMDCCESVEVEDIEGDLTDLLHSPLIVAEESSEGDHPEDLQRDYADSHTWTFYRLSTQKGFVVIRWLGESNGYYSESVDFEEIEAVEPFLDPVLIVLQTKEATSRRVRIRRKG